jgi:hypothetical protein
LTTATNIHFKLNGFSILLSGQTSSFTDCVIENGTITTSNALQRIFTRTIIESFSGEIAGTGGGSIRTFTKCSIFNSNFVFSATPTTRTFTDNYVDKATIISWNSYVAESSTFTNNNFEGILQVNGVLYELKKLKDGITNRPDANVNLLDLATIDPTVYTRKNFAQDPQFLNIEKRDYFSVAPTSPMLFADSTGIGNIGNVRVATVAGGSITDLTTSAGDLLLDPPNTTGQVTSLPIEAFPIAQPIQSLDIAKILNFNSAEGAGTAENNNVVIVENFADLTAGANPRRLTYEMRWTDASAMPLVDADWTCQNYFPISGSAGDWFKFEHDVKPLVDVNGLGNGDPSFNGTGAVGIKARWIQIRVTIIGGIG